MTREDTQKILMAIQSVFPNFHVENKTFTVDTWHMVLQDFRYEDIEMALVAYVRTETKGFAPSPGQLIEKVHLIKEPAEMNEQEAWAIVQKAVDNSAWHYVDEFNKLPETIKKTVGQPSQLHEWAIEENPNHEVRASNFMRNYRTEVNRIKEVRKLPESIRKIIELVNKPESISNKERNKISEEFVNERS